MREALFYEQLDDNTVRCKLCPHECLIKADQAGLCLGRENRDGKLYAFNYGKTMSLSMDPIEKKPLYHFYPGENILSIGPNGCNLHCKFCQNHTSSQTKVPTREISPTQLLSYCEHNNSIGVAYTYTEPFIWYEYILDSAKILHEHGKKVVLVTNGTINEKPLKKILPLVDAMNIDLKSMQADFYQKICSGFLEPVKNTIKLAAQSTHIEITNLVIPDYNDAADNINKMLDFIESVNPDIPLHISRYFPAYKLQAEPTPSSTLQKIYKLAKRRLNHVYIGNINIKNTMNTTCPECGELLIKRQGYFGIKSKITPDNACPECGQKIYGTHLST